MKWIALSCCRVYSMLLQVLPGPDIIFRPVHEKSSAKKEILSKNFFSPFSAKFGHKFFQPAFYFSGPFWAFWPEFQPPGNISSCPTTHPPLPLLPSLPCFLPLPPSSPPTDCSISQILKDDYRLPFYEIIILWVKHLEKVTMIEVLATAKALLPAESRSRSIYFLPLAAGNKCLTASAVGKLTSASEADQFGTTM
jgi:hypothetical protein